MTDDRSLERAARSWLEEGPTRAPDRPVAAALSRIDTTQQERVLRIPWRLPTMFTNRLTVAALATVLIVAAGGFALSRLAGPGSGDRSLPSPTSSGLTITASDVGATLGAGTYRVDGFAADFSVTLPEGWTATEFRLNSIAFALRGDDSRNVYLAVMDKVYHDPCQPADGGATALGPASSIDELVTALSAMKDFEVTEVTDTTIGGAPAKQFRIANSIDVDNENCAGGMLPIGAYDDAGRATNIALFGGETDMFWAVNANGTAVLVAVTDTPAILDATRPVLDGLRFESAAPG